MYFFAKRDELWLQKDQLSTSAKECLRRLQSATLGRVPKKVKSLHLWQNFIELPLANKMSKHFMF